MDDLTMLRDLGRELEHAPPPGLVRHRQRLLDTAAGAATGTERARPRFLTGVIGRTGSRGWPMLALVGVVTAALIIAPTVLLTARHTAGQGAASGGKADRGGAKTALNILIIGSDSRARSTTPGQGAGNRRAGEGDRSDTMMILHLPAGRRSATVLSIPRDTMVRMPACPAENGAPGGPAQTSMINAAYTLGGMSCTLKTIESVTSIRMDHAVTIEFAGFKNMVDALGGVEITLPRAVNDPQAHLNLPAGRQVLDGDQALAYVRARRGLGDGSDLGRIKRQQQFVKALAERARTRLSDPRKLVAFLESAFGSVSTDKDLDLKEALAIARSLDRLPSGAVRTVMLPVRPYPADPNRLEIDPEKAEKIFDSFRTR